MRVWRELLEDARNIQKQDPAARNVAEVLLLYPGFHILVFHRMAHWLYKKKCFFLARLISQLARYLLAFYVQNHF